MPIAAGTLWVTIGAIEPIDLPQPAQKDVIIGRAARGRWNTAAIERLWAEDHASVRPADAA